MITKAKAADVYKGRPFRYAPAQVRAMKAQGLGGIGDREGCARVCTYLTPRDSLASIFLIRGQANARGVVLAE